jgi:TP53 regulating kinase-like protein
MPLIKKGAEANLYLEHWHGLNVILKKRLPKKYRIQELDSKIRRLRTIREAQLIHDVKLIGVSTPQLYSVDLDKKTIVMEYIEGTRVKEALNAPNFLEKEKLCFNIGSLIGKLHNAGIVHGDLTTSNMILLNDRIFLLDLGLGEHSTQLEDKGVDLLLIKRALQSEHCIFFKKGFNALMAGYKEAVGEEVSKEVKKRLKEIERRGRYMLRDM